MSLPVVPARWREEDPTSAQASARRRRVFWLLVLVSVLLAGSAGFLLPRLRPATRCRLVPLFISYRDPSLPPPPWRAQDRDGLLRSQALRGEADDVPAVLDQASLVRELTALRRLPPRESIVVYLSGYARCDAEGAAHILPSGADL